MNALYEGILYFNHFHPRGCCLCLNHLVWFCTLAVPSCNWLYLAVPGCTWLSLGLTVLFVMNQLLFFGGTDNPPTDLQYCGRCEVITILMPASGLTFGVDNTLDRCAWDPAGVGRQLVHNHYFW